MAYQYDKTGLVTQQTWGNGIATATTYDAASRPKRITLSKGGVNLNLTEYSFDANGNRTQERINRPSAAQVTNYSYDAADRLTKTVLTAGSDTATTSWAYDQADNRLSENTVRTGTGAGTTNRSYTYDNRNQLTQIADSAQGTTTLTYDAQGNLKQKQQGAGSTSNNTNFVWSARDLISEISRNGSVLGKYASDHAGMRVSKEALNPLQPGAPPRRLNTQWDEEQALQDRDSSGTVIARYDFAGRHPVALWSAENGNQHLHADALGSIVATTNPGGVIQSETLYDAWGNPTTKTGASANKFAYTGHQADAETGLYYFKARYYDPEIGRFISQDPAEGQDGKPASYHRYLYAYGNPTVYIDPTGEVAFLKEGADTLSEFNEWLRNRASQCQGGVVCGAGALTIGASRAVVGLGELGLRAANVLANTTSLALGGLNSQANIEAHAAELEGTINAAKSAFKAVSTAEGLKQLADKTFGTIDKALVGDSAALSDVAQFGAGFVGGGGALKVGTTTAKTATAVVRQTEQAAAREALRGTASVGKVVGETAEAAAVKQTGRITAEGLDGPSVQATAGKITRSVEAEVSTAVAKVDQPMFGGGGAASLTRRQYIEANLAESRAIRGAIDQGGLSRYLSREQMLQRPASSAQYSVVFEAQLKQGIHYPGKREGAHFAESNRQMYDAMQADKSFAEGMESAYPGLTDFVAPGVKGGFERATPTMLGLTWHHHPSIPGLMQLIPQAHHKARGAVQKTLHPDRSGGMENWGEGTGRKRTRK